MMGGKRKKGKPFVLYVGMVYYTYIYHGLY